MSTQAARSVRAILASFTPIWLWTWNGVCFGYRRGDSLFTYDGIEVGRFSGAEVYGADGSYLGELKSTEEDGDRLITNRLTDDGVWDNIPGYETVAIGRSSPSTRHLHSGGAVLPWPPWWLLHNQR
jgi:hypothetical protein